MAIDVETTTPERVEREYPGALLPVADAAWAAGLSRTELTDRIHRGELRVHRLRKGSRVIAAVCLADMERLVRERELAPEAQAESAASVADVVDVARLRERLARLEGELTASERVERSLQRYADRLEERSAARAAELEERLVEARRRETTLARMLGSAEAKLERFAQLEAPQRRRRGLFGRRAS